MRPAPPQSRDVLHLAIPAFFTLIAEPLFLATDSAIVGHLGTLPLAALAAASTLLTSATGIFVFLAYATTASVAQLIGAGRREEGIQAGMDGAWLALLLGIVMTGITALAAHPLCEWVAGPDATPLATHYLLISALGLPAILLNLALTGLFRGLSDTRTPLLITTVGFGVNAALNVILVLGLGMGIAGSALGTTIATWGMAIVQIGVARRSHKESAARKPHLGRIGDTMRDGLPLLVRTLALRGILVLLTALAGGFSVTVLAAHQIVSTVFTFESFALDALAIAAQTLIGQALGGGSRDETRSLTKLFIRWSIWCGCTLGVLLLVSAPILPRIFTSQQAVSHAATWGIVLMAAITPISAVLFVLDGILMGAGDGVFLAKVQLALLGVFAIGFTAIQLYHHSLVLHGATAEILACWGLYCFILLGRTALLLVRSRTDKWMVLSL